MTQEIEDEGKVFIRRRIIYLEVRKRALGVKKVLGLGMREVRWKFEKRGVGRTERLV